MDSKIIAGGILRATGTLVLIVVFLCFLYKIQTVLIYLLVASVLTLILNPVLKFFKKRLKFRNTSAAVSTILLFILFIAGFIVMFVPLILAQWQSLSQLDTVEVEKNGLQVLNHLSTWLTRHDIDSSKLLKEVNNSFKINYNIIPLFFTSILDSISNVIIGLVAILFITFFFLKDEILLIEGVKKIIPETHQKNFLQSVNKTNQMLSRYFIGLMIQLSILFVLYLGILLVFGVQNAFVIAFLSAILNIVPYIGPLFAAFLAAILTMIGNLGGDFQTQILPTTLYVLVGFIIVHIIDSNFNQPLIFSRSVSSHPLEIFLIILLAGFLFGIMGMIVAIPLFTVIKVFGKEFFPENKIIQMLTKNI